MPAMMAYYPNNYYISPRVPMMLDNDAATIMTFIAERAVLVILL